MSILNFPENQFVEIFNFDDEIQISRHTLSENCELSNIRMKFYKKGSNNTARVRLKIYPVDSNNYKYASGWVNLADITDNFYGLLRFDFLNCNLQAGFYFNIKCEIENYTRDADNSYFALVYDFPFGVYGTIGTHFNENPISLEDFAFV